MASADKGYGLQVGPAAEPMLKFAMQHFGKAHLGTAQMSSAFEPVGTLEVALAHTERLLKSDPVLAAEQAAEILKAVPNHPVATLLMGIACRSSGDAASAIAILEPPVLDRKSVV